jgi:hypothetical protein
MIREKDFLRKQASPYQGSEGVLGGERAKLGIHKRKGFSSKVARIF